MEQKKFLNTTAVTQLISTRNATLFFILAGSIFLGLVAQIAIPLPFTPVPVTLQTLGVALLAISLGGRNAALAICAYLTQATAGLPVLAGGISNPLWMIGPRAGYLLTYILTAYVVGKLIEKQTKFSFWKMWLIVSMNELLILSIGSLWLGFFVGWNHAFAMGFLPFIPGAVLKITMAVAAIKPVHYIKQKFNGHSSSSTQTS